MEKGCGLDPILKSSELLRQILEKITAAGPGALVVFDLDSTLFDVSHRTQKIISDFTLQSGMEKKYPESIEALKLVKVSSDDWGLRDLLQRHGMGSHAPEFLEAIREYWIERFFKGDYLQHDHPIKGAPEFVKKVKDTGARVVYLTGRDEGTMLEASRMVLATHGFPQAELYLKPVKGSDDSLFKLNWFSEQNIDRYDPIYFFENEPVNIHEVTSWQPRVQIVFVDSTHSGKSEVSPEWPHIKDFT